MTPDPDPRNDLSTPGDPKDNHQEQSTSAPEQGGVATPDRGIGDRGIGGIEELQDHQSGEGAQTFKGMNSLVTREPGAFEHAPQEAAYAGADPADFGDVPVSAVMPGSGLGSVGTAPSPFLERDIDPNPGYTPPSEVSRPHPHKGAELSAGAPGEAGLADTTDDPVTGESRNR